MYIMYVTVCALLVHFTYAVASPWWYDDYTASPAAFSPFLYIIFLNPDWTYLHNRVSYLYCEREKMIKYCICTQLRAEARSNPFCLLSFFFFLDDDNGSNTLVIIMIAKNDFGLKPSRDREERHKISRRRRISQEGSCADRGCAWKYPCEERSCSSHQQTSCRNWLNCLWYNGGKSVCHFDCLKSVLIGIIMDGCVVMSLSRKNSLKNNLPFEMANIYIHYILYTDKIFHPL